jgi:nucleoside-diphosphate-sugar epimerase
MKILVSGAGGFLGRLVVERLLRGGYEVRAIIRPASSQPAWSGSVEVCHADLRVPDKLTSVFVGIDAVIHLAAATSGSEEAQFASSVVGTENFLNAMAQSTVKRLIHVSSLVVYDWSRAGAIMDEETVLRRDMYDMGAYTIAKIWQERVVQQFAKVQGWELTIMRPGFVWGPRHAELAGMGRRLGRLYVTFGPFARLPLCYVANCADCLVTALGHPAAIGETFNVIDGDDVRVWRYVREYARRTGRRGFVLPVPYRLGLGVAHLAAAVSRSLFGQRGKLPSILMPRRFESQFKPIRFSNKKLRQRLGWTPPLTFSECLNLTYAPSR